MREGGELAREAIDQSTAFRLSKLFIRALLLARPRPARQDGFPVAESVASELNVSLRVRWRSLLYLAWPIVLARATQAVIGFTDALMVAPLGKESLAATTTGGLDAFAFIILPMGTVFIVQSFTSQLRGQGDLVAARRYAYYGLAVALLAALIGLGAIPFLPRALGLFGYEPRVHELMCKNASIRLLSVGGAVATEALGNYFGGLGRTRPAMVAGIIAMVVNVGANWLLIEPHFGLPGYGVAGSAAASVFATWLGFITIAWLFLRDGGLAPSGLAWAEFGRMLRLPGLPNGVNWFLEFAAFLLVRQLPGVGHLGTTELAAFNVVLQINTLSFMPAFGIASAGAILVGEQIGRRALEDVWPTVRMTAIVSGLLDDLRQRLVPDRSDRDRRALPVARGSERKPGAHRRDDARALRRLAALRRGGEHAERNAARRGRHHLLQGRARGAPPGFCSSRRRSGFRIGAAAARRACCSA